VDDNGKAMNTKNRAVLFYIAAVKIFTMVVITCYVIPYVTKDEKDSPPSNLLSVTKEEYITLSVARPLRRGTNRKLMGEEDARHGIIYAPGHDPHDENSTSIEGYNLTKARQYIVDGMLEDGMVYMVVAGVTCLLGAFVFLLLLVHTWQVRRMVAQDAYDMVYPVLLRARVNGVTQKDFRGICNLYINKKIVSIIWIFALGLVIYNPLVLICPLFIPKTLVCAPDPAWLSLVHLPVNAIAVILLILAMFHWNYHSVMIHSVITIYASVFLCMVTFGLASAHKPLCVQNVATQVMFTLSAWIFFWPPKIAGAASLRDRLAWERRVLKVHDKVEVARLRELFGTERFRDVNFTSDSSESEQPLENPISVIL
jgi:hypothetical protein